MKLGISIPSYNPRYDWLHAAIESVANVADEIMIVDHGSDQPIRFSGIPVMRVPRDVPYHDVINCGIWNLRTEWIISLADDDMAIPDALAELKTMLGLVYHGDVVSTTIRIFGDENYDWGERLDPTYLLFNNHVPGMSPFRKRAWEEIGGYELEWLSDWHFFLKLAVAGRQFDFHPTATIMHRRHKGQRGDQMPEKRRAELMPEFWASLSRINAERLNENGSH